MKAIKHFQTITKHKILVMQECFRVGLYRQGLLHDLSKYGWTEFRVGCRRKYHIKLHMSQPHIRRMFSEEQ